MNIDDVTMDAKWYAEWVRLLPASSGAEKMRNLEAADVLESQAEEIEHLKATLKAAEKDIRKLLLLLMSLARRGEKSAALACNYCAECDLLKCAADCKGHARWRGITEPDEWERAELEDE